MASKKSDPIEEAMAEALKSVERIERGEDASEENDVESEIPDAANDTAESEADADEQDDVAALKDQLLRLAADFDNYRKRARREKEEARRYGTERVLVDLLPVIDNLERALSHADDQDPIAQGVRMVTKQFLDALSAHGVEGFASTGQPFDPERHEAMTQAPAGDVDPGTVLEELEKGYLLHDRLLRPAKVVVAAFPEPEPEEEAEADASADDGDDDAEDDA